MALWKPSVVPWVQDIFFCEPSPRFLLEQKLWLFTALFALFTRLAQRSTGGSPLWSSGTQVSHSVVRVNEGDCMCLVFLCWLETNTAHNVLWFWSYYFKHSGKSTGMCTLNSGCQFKSGYLFWSSSTPCMKESKLLAVSFSFNSNNFRSAQWHSFLYMAFDVKFCRTVF